MTTTTTMMTPKRNVSDLRNRQDHCALVKESPGRLGKYKAAATEYLLQRISPLVIQEANQKMGIVFGGTAAPSTLVTLHIWWGNKFLGMDLPGVEEYVEADWIVTMRTTTMTTERSATTATTSSSSNTTAYNINIYLRGIYASQSAETDYPNITLQEINAF
jgi:hypothetical protein